MYTGRVSTPPRANPPASGLRLGEFEVLGVLGRGGSGEVYAARWGHRRVALKVLAAEHTASDRGRQQFLSEASQLQKLNHRNVVKVLAAGVFDDGRPYLAMEFLEGGTLATRLGRGPLGLATALQLFMQIAEAVIAMHDAALVHRDLKPENVFVIDDAHAVLLDFGIAKDLEAAPTTITQEGLIRGTPAYMAPERFFGQAAGVATDVYELALLLYTMLAGRLPWTDELDPAARLDPRPLSEAPAALDIVVRKALSTRAANRPASVRDLKHAVAAAVPASVPPGGLPRELPPFGRATADVRAPDVAVAAAAAAEEGAVGPVAAALPPAGRACAAAAMDASVALAAVGFQPTLRATPEQLGGQAPSTPPTMPGRPAASARPATHARPIEPLTLDVAPGAVAENVGELRGQDARLSASTLALQGRRQPATRVDVVPPPNVTPTPGWAGRGVRLALAALAAGGCVFATWQVLQPSPSVVPERHPLPSRSAPTPGSGDAALAPDPWRAGAAVESAASRGPAVWTDGPPMARKLVVASMAETLMRLPPAAVFVLGVINQDWRDSSDGRAIGQTLKGSSYAAMLKLSFPACVFEAAEDASWLAFISDFKRDDALLLAGGAFSREALHQCFTQLAAEAASTERDDVAVWRWPDGANAAWSKQGFAVSRSRGFDAAAVVAKRYRTAPRVQTLLSRVSTNHSLFAVLDAAPEQAIEPLPPGLDITAAFDIRPERLTVDVGFETASPDAARELAGKSQGRLEQAMGADYAALLHLKFGRAGKLVTLRGNPPMVTMKWIADALKTPR